VSDRSNGGGAGDKGVDAAALSTFMDEVFAGLSRVDQRRWAREYLSGLLRVPGKKTPQRLAGTGPGAPMRARALQQFIGGSPWDWGAVRDELAGLVRATMPVSAWTLAAAVIPKRGDSSVGVHRRYLPERGKEVNCQLAVGLFLSGERDTIPVDWHVLLDDSWSDRQRRQRVKVPDDAAAGPLWHQLVDLVDAAAGRRVLPAGPLVADLRGLVKACQFAVAMGERKIGFVLEVGPEQKVLAPVAGSPANLARFSVDGYLGNRLRRAPGTHAAKAGGRVVNTFSAMVYLPSVDGDGPLLACRLLGVSTPGVRPGARYWLTNLGDHTPADVVRLTVHALRTPYVLACLSEDFGLMDFEGRSFPAWHHHMTMVSLAYALHRFTQDDSNSGRLRLVR
jgi:hypothetical protein